MKPSHLSLLPILSISAGCASTPVNPRFVNAAPVLRVDDRRDVPKPPAVRAEAYALYYFDGDFGRVITRPMELPRARRALGVNALDEVPDSTWFTNRIGARNLTLDELRRGPATIGNPGEHLPWTIHARKSSGESFGLLISDARGERFLIKFDRRGFPDAETATQVIVGRFLWACGYNVTDDYIARIRPGDLVLAANATKHNSIGETRQFSAADLASSLEHVDKMRDGRIRVIASRILVGKPLGGHPGEGKRRDDPNDVIDHEMRRDLRGMLPIYAWLDHVDVKEANTLDVWVEDLDDARRHFVVHYFLDFGKSLGMLAFIGRHVRAGFEYSVDYPAMMGSLVTLGFAPRPFESRDNPPFRGVGMYRADNFEPDRWRPNTQAYLPFHTADRLDRFWGAKILARFTPQQIGAIVDTGELSDPRAAAYLTEVLVSRQRAVAAHAFAQVSPLDNFHFVDGPALCFDDLMLVYRLSSRPTEYAVRTFDRQGRAFSAQRVRETPGGRTCTNVLDVAATGDGYTVVEIETRREATPRSTFVHVARDPKNGEWRVIGIWRE